jgi:hypothetical protein
MDYITESDDNISGLKDEYTLSKPYTYFLELDENENIIGGEWLMKSKSAHPDFIYVPVGTVNPDTSILGSIQYSEIKKMIELSQ